MKYPLYKPPTLTGKYLKEVTDSGWYAPGPQNENLKEEMAQFLGCTPDNIILGSSATALFHALLLYLSDTMKDPPYEIWFDRPTFPGLYRVKQALNNWVQVFEGDADLRVYTDIGGACDIPCQPVHGYILHDACHGWQLSKLFPKRSHPTYTLLSFYPTKLVPGCEGGALICTYLSDAQRLRRTINCNLLPLYGNNSSIRFDDIWVTQGAATKATMPDLMAALNREALEVAPNYIADIREAFCELATAARDSDLNFLSQPIRPYLFQLVFDLPEWNHSPTNARRALITSLTAKGIPTGWNFPPSPFVTLPCYPGLTRTDAHHIIRAVKESLND